MGAMPPSPHLEKWKWGVCAERMIRFGQCGGRQGQGPFFDMGAGPHTPIWENRNGGACAGWFVCFRCSGAYNLCEYVLSGKLVCGFVCGTSRLHIPVNRVSPSAGARISAMLRRPSIGCSNHSSPVSGYGAQPHVHPPPLGWQKLCEHLLPGKMADGSACRADRFYSSSIRVRQRVRWAEKGRAFAS